MPPTPALPRISRLSVASWVTYDLANTIYSMGVVSLFYPHFVERVVGAEQVGRVFGLIQSVSYAIIFILSPTLGAMTDRARRRMPFLVWTTFLCVAATAFIGRGSFWMSAVLFVFSNAAYQAGIQFYDSLLVEVTTEENRGRVSGIGVGIGYVGSFVAVALGLLLGESGYQSPLEFWPLFVWLAVSFLALAIPCFIFVRERGNPNPRPVFEWNAVRASASETIQTIKSGRQYPGLIRFLVGRVFYTDAINTTIGFMALYVMHVSAAAGLSDKAGGDLKNYVMVVAIGFAVIAGLVWGRLTDRLGPKRTLDIVLGLWIFTLRAGRCRRRVRTAGGVVVCHRIARRHRDGRNLVIRPSVHAAAHAAAPRRRVLWFVRHGRQVLGHHRTSALGGGDVALRRADRSACRDRRCDRRVADAAHGGRELSDSAIRHRRTA
jgi:UMF1 family MFS transporter